MAPNEVDSAYARRKGKAKRNAKYASRDAPRKLPATLRVLTRSEENPMGFHFRAQTLDFAQPIVFSGPAAI
jgi:hypothetical protein